MDDLWNDIIRKRREAVELGYIRPGEKIKDYLQRIERLKELAKDESDPRGFRGFSGFSGFISVNAISSLEYLKENIPKKWRRTVVKFLQWWRERKEKSAY